MTTFNGGDEKKHPFKLTPVTQIEETDVQTELFDTIKKAIRPVLGLPHKNNIHKVTLLVTYDKENINEQNKK